MCNYVLFSWDVSTTASPPVVDDVQMLVVSLDCFVAALLAMTLY